MESKNPNPSVFSWKCPWDENDNSIWLASTVTLLRNIEKFKFPSKLPIDKRKQVVSLVAKELLALPLLKNPLLYKAEEMSHLEKEFLVEHFLTMQSFHQAHSGEAFVIDETGNFFASLNVGNHLQLQLTDCQGDIENVWNKLVKIETTLGKSINYSFSSRFGFLTADATQCGTALFVTIFLQLPALIHTEKLEECLEKHCDESIAISGLQGNPNELIGDILAIHNNYTLGLTEENILSCLRTLTTKLLVYEKSERNRIRTENNSEIKDRISRTYGIVMHSYQIEAIEALNALSLIKLGIELGWMEGSSLRQLNELSFKCRRAHLLSESGEKVSQEEVPHRRSAFLRKELSALTLKI